MYVLWFIFYAGLLLFSYNDLLRVIHSGASLSVRMSCGACTGVLFAVLCIHAGTQLPSYKGLSKSS